jgi:hypothetical protein
VSLFDVGARFEGGKTLLRVLRDGGGFGADIASVPVGALVVCARDAPALNLWSSQAYALKRAYYQRRGDTVGSGRVDVETIGAAPPPREEGERDGEWQLWVELFRRVSPRAPAGRSLRNSPARVRFYPRVRSYRRSTSTPFNARPRRLSTPPDAFPFNSTPTSLAPR